MSAELREGDALELMAAMDPESVHAIITDGPYGIEFMGKEWDKHASPADFQAWTTQWAREAMRVLVPGGWLISFGGTRTYHRMASGVEDAGFEIRDMIEWLYGQGFPKSLDAGKSIDKHLRPTHTCDKYPDPECHCDDPDTCNHPLLCRDQAFHDVWDRTVVGVNPNARTSQQNYSLDGEAPNFRAEYRPISAPASDAAKKWSGWGTALKPAHEPILVARKPMVGTLARNLLAHGAGALNIDAGRIAGPKGDGVWGTSNKTVDSERTFVGSPDAADYRTEQHAAGRWPANVILDEEAGAMLDEQSGTKMAKGHVPKKSNAEGMWSPKSGGGGFGPMEREEVFFATGGASRFFYCAKAGKKERNGDWLDEPINVKATHPTVKPVALMRYLVRLFAPPGTTVLDPFTGSGTTGVAVLQEGEGRRFIGMERDAEYAKIARARLRLSGGDNEPAPGSPPAEEGQVAA